MTRILNSLFLFSFLAIGCGHGPSLEGEWQGEMECGGNGYETVTFDVMMELEREDEDYEGEGEIDLGLIDGVGYWVTFDLELEKEQPRGEQELDIDLDACAIHADGGGKGDLGCDEIDDVEWDGEDEIIAEVPGFIDLDWNCEMKLER